MSLRCHLTKKDKNHAGANVFYCVSMVYILFSMFLSEEKTLMEECFHLPIDILTGETELLV